MIRIKKITKYAAVPLILLVGAVAMQALGSTQKQTSKRAPEPEARVVQTERLAFGDMTLTLEGNGVIESERTLNIVAEVPGRVTFARNELKEGTYVREGDVVVRIYSTDVENQLHALRSDFLNAVASVLPELQLNDAKIWRKWFDYFNSLDIDGEVPELPEITNPQEKIKISTKDIIGKYYEVKNQEIRLARHTVRAPFSGYIGSEGVIAGTVVSTGQPLFSLSDAANLVVAVPLLVEESQSIDFSKRPRATVYAEQQSGETKQGRITRKQTRVDRNSQTLNVYVTFKNYDLNPHFLPGNYVHVEIEARTLSDVATVPRHLLDDENHVFTMEPDGTLGRQPLDVVAVQEDLAVVRNTVPEGTVIVRSIIQKPLLGMEVRSANMPELNPETEFTGSDAGDEPVAADARTEASAAGGA